ncbi:MAG: ABC transporter ATP-binding protein [Bacteroidota bacterium]
MQGIYKYHYTRELETTAVNGVDLEVYPGDFLAIMGPSGSGKSTLLNLVGMIDKPSKGSYFFKGASITDLNKKQLRRLRKDHLAYIFQSFNLIDGLTAAENIELPLAYLKVPVKERKARVEQALLDLEMLHRKNHYPKQLSGGQQQRVAIARAIVTKPDLILADEPTGNLDSKNSAIVLDTLRQFNENGTTIIMVTHSKQDASKAKRIIELFDGQILFSETNFKAQIKTNSNNF